MKHLTRISFSVGLHRKRYGPWITTWLDHVVMGDTDYYNPPYKAYSCGISIFTLFVTINWDTEIHNGDPIQ